MTQNARHWFVSDTHFCEHRPEHIQAFLTLCTLPKPGDSLVLLGDIFEIWIGDDLANSNDNIIEHALLECQKRAVNVFFMHGNRDFMIGSAFTKRTGCQLLNDPSVWTLPTGAKCLLTHGDWFCTDEARYRRYRRAVRNPLFQYLFSLLPKRKRLAIATRIRQKSMAAHEQKQQQSYDANATLIQYYFDKYAPINTMIMGHTHLPDLHQNGKLQRLVLGDWRDSLWFAIASEEHGIELFEADLELKRAQQRFQLNP